MSKVKNLTVFVLLLAGMWLWSVEPGSKNQLDSTQATITEEIKNLKKEIGEFRKELKNSATVSKTPTSDLGGSGGNEDSSASAAAAGGSGWRIAAVVVGGTGLVLLIGLGVLVLLEINKLKNYTEERLQTTNKLIITQCRGNPQSSSSPEARTMQSAAFREFELALRNVQQNTIPEIDEALRTIQSLWAQNVEAGVKMLNSHVGTVQGNVVKIQQNIADIQQNMENIRKCQPECCNWAVVNAVEVVRTCYECGMTEPEQIKNALEIFGYLSGKELFSPQDVEACIEKGRKYSALEEKYSAAAETVERYHDYETLKAQRDAFEKQIPGLTDKAAKAEENAKQFKNERDELRGQVDRLNTEKGNLETSEKGLKATLGMLVPADIQTVIDAIRNLDPQDGTGRLPLICCQVAQLYWYSQCAAGDPSRIKAAFMRFDDGIYELLADQPEKLTRLREELQNFINSKILDTTSYEMEWPEPGTSVSENEDWYYRENAEGNRISRLRSAVIFNEGKVESRARVYTSV